MQRKINSEKNSGQKQLAMILMVNWTNYLKGLCLRPRNDRKLHLSVLNPILAGRGRGKFASPSLDSKILIEGIGIFLSFFMTFNFYLSYDVPENQSCIKIG